MRCLGDYAAAAHFISHHLRLKKTDLADLCGYSLPYFSELLSRKQYSPNAEETIMETLRFELGERGQAFPEGASTTYHLRLSSKSLNAPGAVDIVCYGDVVCLVKFIMSSYGLSRAELASYMGQSIHSVNRMLEPLGGHPLDERSAKIEEAVTAYVQTHKIPCRGQGGQARYVVYTQSRPYDASRRRILIRNED